MTETELPQVVIDWNEPFVPASGTVTFDVTEIRCEGGVFLSVSTNDSAKCLGLMQYCEAYGTAVQEGVYTIPIKGVTYEGEPASADPAFVVIFFDYVSGQAAPARAGIMVYADDPSPDADPVRMPAGVLLLTDGPKPKPEMFAALPPCPYGITHLVTKDQIPVTKAELDVKQDALTAGNLIRISDAVISSTAVSLDTEWKSARLSQMPYNRRASIGNVKGPYLWEAQVFTQNTGSDHDKDIHYSSGLQLHVGSTSINGITELTHQKGLNSDVERMALISLRPVFSYNGESEDCDCEFSLIEWGIDGTLTRVYHVYLENMRFSGSLGYTAQPTFDDGQQLNVQLRLQIPDEPVLEEGDSSAGGGVVH